jgi:hypothetical protein
MARQSAASIQSGMKPANSSGVIHQDYRRLWPHEPNGESLEAITANVDERAMGIELHPKFLSLTQTRCYQLLQSQLLPSVAKFPSLPSCHFSPHLLIYLYATSDATAKPNR